MGNFLFYGALGFSICVFSACVGIFIGKALARNNNAGDRQTYEEMDGDYDWTGRPHPD